MTTLNDPIPLGTLQLRNRIVASPLTRILSAHPGSTAAVMATEYAQRTIAGLIIAEGPQGSRGQQPGSRSSLVVSPEEISSWRSVTDAVHASDGAIFSQLLDPGKAAGPGALRPGPAPGALWPAEIREAAGAYAGAARHAIDAGFDGVEVHGATGSQIAQFLSRSTNRRSDRYGGNLSGRIRFAIEAVSATVSAVGAARVGLRLSPGADSWNAVDSDAPELYGSLLAHLAPLGLAYVHLTASTTDEMFVGLRSVWPGVLIANPSTLAHPVPRIEQKTAETLAEQARLWLSHGADLISMGRPLLGSPELSTRLGLHPAQAQDHTLGVPPTVPPMTAPSIEAPVVRSAPVLPVPVEAEPADAR